MDFEHFDWDHGNIEHLTDLTTDEVKKAVLAPDRIGVGAYNALGERRWALLGATVDNEILFVVYTWRHGKVCVVTARLAEPNERRRYRTRGK
jgi:uncharacterized protein